MTALPYDFNGPIPGPYDPAGTGYLGAFISATAHPNTDLPAEDFPSLRRIIVVDLVGPIATNAQHQALEKRDEFLRSILVKIQATMNVLDTTFLRRDGSTPKDSNTGLRADIPANSHALTGLRAGVAPGESVRYDELAAEISRATGVEGTKAPLDSPHFTGTPILPTGTTGVTQSPLDNSTKMATTAYTDAAVLVEKGRAQGVEGTLAPLNSPSFTGTPSLPTGATGVTQALNNNSTKLATTAYADAAAAAAADGLGTAWTCLASSSVGTSATFTVTKPGIYCVMMIGGGGGGAGGNGGLSGANGGGGGGGKRGSATVFFVYLSAGSISVTAGGWGTGSSGSDGSAAANGNPGGTSYFGTLTSAGGAGGIANTTFSVNTAGLWSAIGNGFGGACNPNAGFGGAGGGGGDGGIVYGDNTTPGGPAQATAGDNWVSAVGGGAGIGYGAGGGGGAGYEVSTGAGNGGHGAGGAVIMFLA